MGYWQTVDRGTLASPSSVSCEAKGRWKKKGDWAEKGLDEIDYSDVVKQHLNGGLSPGIHCACAKILPLTAV